MNSSANTNYRRDYGEMITWMKDKLDSPNNALSKQIRIDLIKSVFKTGLMFFVMVVCSITFFHYFIIDSFLLDGILFVLGTAFAIYKGLFLGCVGVYEKYNTQPE